MRGFGGVCDGKTDDTAALRASLAAATAANRGSGGVVDIPAGTCRIAGAVVATVPAGQGLSIRGAGRSVSILLFDGDGGAVTLADARSSLDVADLTLRHNATSAQAGTGLSVTANALGGSAALSNVQFDGVARGGSWLVGARFVNVGPSLQTIGVFLPDVSGPPSASKAAGLVIAGTAGAKGAPSRFAVNTRISDSIFQGGYAGVRLDGPVQGLFFSNSLSAGNNYGIYASSTPDLFPEMITLSNWHFESHLAGLYARGFNQIMVGNGLNLHFNTDADAYRGIDVAGAQFVTVTGSMFNGNGRGVDERAIAIADSAFVVVTANQASLVAGAMIDTARVSHAIITNNVGVRFTGYTGAKVAGCGATVTCADNQFDGAVRAQ